jgi:hypothetical protein
MNGVLFDQSKIELLTEQLAGTLFAGSNVQMALFYGITSLDHTDTYAGLVANEASFTGYARQTVTGWGTPTLTADFHARSQALTVTFSNTGGSDSSSITAWALIDTGSNKLIQGGLYDVPFVIPAGQDYLTTPFWTRTGEISHEP